MRGCCRHGISCILHGSRIWQNIVVKEKCSSPKRFSDNTKEVCEIHSSCPCHVDRSQQYRRLAHNTILGILVGPFFNAQRKTLKTNVTRILDGIILLAINFQLTCFCMATNYYHQLKIVR